MRTNDTSHQPAFAAPREYFSDDYGAPACMNKRMYAAIKLRVPDSGEEWLNAMIRQSLRDEFAGKAMQAMIALAMTAPTPERAARAGGLVSSIAYSVADTMLEARTDAQDAQ